MVEEAEPNHQLRQEVVEELGVGLEVMEEVVGELRVELHVKVEAGVVRVDGYQLGLSVEGAAEMNVGLGPAGTLRPPHWRQL